MFCDDNPAATGDGGDLSPMTVTVIVMLMLSIFLHYLLPRAREAKNVMRLADDTAATEQLSADEVAIIFGFLSHQDIMRARVCSTWKDAAKKTIVPPSNFVADSLRSFNAMRVMATALPTLQQLSLRGLSGLDMYTNGEDQDERMDQHTANFIIMSIISNFRKLRVLEILNAPLNGRYPSSFNFWGI